MDDYLSVSQVAAKLGVNTRTVHRLISSGVIAAEKLAGVFFIKPSEVSKAVQRPKVGRPPKKSDK